MEIQKINLGERKPNKIGVKKLTKKQIRIEK